ncbi:CGNR zinc finger domain-containing protein [Actinomadura sp. HBU206391]|uniref:CGNR zinc finger domain-containing protein n=1 Tax=Actinomadura sp. HBU206391 TaxID=2731692 RepID=UPI00164F64A9|nr:ABATE domain-containing protein [Actinomadura sp. HBU206391]MBC6460108.1 ABATE domain-containing protein [Actinomadura sp. HBU206391]
MPEGWIWDGGRPCVDLLNTLRDRMSGGRETLWTPADLSAWLEEAGLLEGVRGDAGPLEDGGVEAGPARTPTSARATERDLLSARELRAAVDTAAFAVIEERPVPEGVVATINASASAVSMAPSLALDARGRPVLTRNPSAAVPTALAEIAVDAIGLLTDGELTRLRVCAADDCGVRFLDRSPARNRQWCSMRRCGNRTKARRHYARGRD